MILREVVGSFILITYYETVAAGTVLVEIQYHESSLDEYFILRSGTAELS